MPRSFVLGLYFHPLSLALIRQALLIRCGSTSGLHFPTLVLESAPKSTCAHTSPAPPRETRGRFTMRPSPIRTRLSNPCFARKYAAAGAGDPEATAPVFCEHGGVRIAASQGVATKVPSIRELILQLNRRQQMEPTRLNAPVSKR